MNIAIIAAGAAGRYCGSCLRDTTLAAALRRAGHDVALIPLYTPLRTEQPDIETCPVFYGGVNVFLQQKMQVFRHTPRAIDRFFDSKFVLGLAGKYSDITSPAELGRLTVSILKGELGRQVKELNRLLEFLRELKPDIIHLPNAMFAGIAGAIRRTLAVPVVCSLTGEDIFLDGLSKPYRDEAHGLIAEASENVSLFIATSSYYAGHSSSMFGIDASKIRVVSTGIEVEHFARVSALSTGGTPNIGYLARICPEKGLDILVDAVVELHRVHKIADIRLKVAGYLPPSQANWLDGLRIRLVQAGMPASFAYAGEVDMQGKVDFFAGLDLFSVPTRYPEAKGIYVLEALAAGVPVVQPAHGSFPELIENTAGGVLFPPGDAAALARELAALLADPEHRRGLGNAGREAVRRYHTAEIMADQTVRAYQSVM